MNSANAVPVTLAELHALSATAGGRVKRIYHMDKNTLKAEGISSAVLWRLDRKKLIEDGPESGYHAYTQILTPAGTAALDVGINGSAK